MPIFRCQSKYERDLHRLGYTRVAGVDEVGRGSLFGPVFAAAVVLDPARAIRGLRDSKMLAPERRGELAVRIRARAVAFAVGAADVFEIDRFNILQGARLAMRRAVEKLQPAPDYLLVDATTVDLPLPQRALIHGDALSQCIAAASILAKVMRDRLMTRLAVRYPAYGWERNAGYSTPEHYAAIAAAGPCRHHRMGFAPFRTPG